MDHEKLFKATNGLSFNCKTETTLILADFFRVKLVPLQIQAFDLNNGDFGKGTNDILCICTHSPVQSSNIDTKKKLKKNLRNCTGFNRNINGLCGFLLVLGCYLADGNQ